MVRGKWRIGFLAVRNINAGDEVVWDYKVEGQDWSVCKLISGLVKRSKRWKRNRRERGRERERERERGEGGSERGREGGREGGKEGGREGGRERGSTEN